MTTLSTSDTLTMVESLEMLERIVDDVVRPRAAETDRAGAFPREAVAALGEAGLLGLLSSPEVGGQGADLRTAAAVIERLAGACGSTAMVVLMHYVGSTLIEVHGPIDVRRRIAAGEHLTSLAFSEVGSRSHFWAPLGTATRGPDTTVALNARKSWVTSAGEADSYVWSSRPISGDAGMTLWLVPRDTPDLRVAGAFDGLGLRGNASRPVAAEDVRIPAEAMLAADGAGMDAAFATALPTFLVLNAAFSLGLCEALAEEGRAHLLRTRLEHLGQSLAQQPATRLAYSRIRITVDQVRAFLQDTLAAIDDHRDDEMLRVLEVKAVAAEGATAVADATMRICGGAAFRKELGVERRFRDSLAARVMAPTTDALYDFVGRVSCGMPLFDEDPA
jgi:alkylation response protein AidB-like acyl-CoA dehydrogenase